MEQELDLNLQELGITYMARPSIAFYSLAWSLVVEKQCSPFASLCLDLGSARSVALYTQAVWYHSPWNRYHLWIPASFGVTICGYHTRYQPEDLWLQLILATQSANSIRWILQKRPQRKVG